MNTALQESKVYFRDAVVEFDEARLSVASSPFLYGLSIYTVFGASYNKQQKKLYMFRLRDHYERLVNSSRIVDFDSFAKDWPFERFEAAMRELLKENKVRHDVLVRVSVFVDDILSGTKTHDLPTSLSAFVYPAYEFLPLDGANLCVSSWLRTPDNAIPARAKVNGSYVNAALMKNEALHNGYDDAISLDEHGHVCESTVANIFLVRDGMLLTPSGSTHLLEGITRDSLFAIADELGIPHDRRNIDRSELYVAQEVLLSGSSAQVTPVVSVDRRLIGDGKPGPVTRRLMKAYSDVQYGNMPAFKRWLTTV